MSQTGPFEQPIQPLPKAAYVGWCTRCGGDCFDGVRHRCPSPVAGAKELRAEIDRLRRDCAELYQVIGTMAEHCPNPADPAIIKALDNASDAANGDPRRHDDLLPFILPARADEQNARTE